MQYPVPCHLIKPNNETWITSTLTTPTNLELKDSDTPTTVDEEWKRGQGQFVHKTSEQQREWARAVESLLIWATKQIHITVSESALGSPEAGS